MVNSTKSADSSAWRDRSTPICSTVSNVSLIPAVSNTWMGVPPTTKVDSITSRVVPGKSVTIARSLWLQALSKLDLPTLGRPTIATFKPFLSSSPRSAVAKIVFTWVNTACSCCLIASSSRGGKSSSKSIRASTSAKISKQVARNWRIGWANLPCNPANAAWDAAWDCAATNLEILSAWVKSILPLRNARKVNSPGWANLAPWEIQSCNTCCTGTIPPWQWNSITSSRV